MEDEKKQNNYMSSDYGSAAISGWQAGGPVGAGVAVGGRFLENYLAQKAAEEKERRQQAAMNAQSYAQNQQQGFDTLMRTYGGALR